MYLMYTLDADGKRVYTLQAREGGGMAGGRRCAGRRARARARGPHAALPSPPVATMEHCSGSWCRTAAEAAAHVGRGGAGGHMPPRGGRRSPPPPPPHTQKALPDGTPTASAHPARFSPDDKFSRERVETKRRFGLLPTQRPAPVL